MGSFRQERPFSALSAWTTGLRSSQANSRAAVKKIELDSIHNNILKVNPLAGWQEQEVWD
ncbi:MAG: phosphoadenosine phosphosulfate reductase family protein [Deltaproteobacteria bacterium]|nr:phosphoadenosine phosphosulfate reductase family protein [Deltaproteobacteria bacterium]